MIASYRHPDSIKETTRITERIAAAGITLKVRNTQGIVANDYIVLGKIGNEQTEIVKVATVDSNTQFTIGATKFSHDIDSIVSFIQFNKIQFASATTKTGIKTYYPSSTTGYDIEVDDYVTEQNLTSVTSGYVFARYWNEHGNEYSGWSDAMAVAGFDEDSMRHIIDMARLRTDEETEDLVTDDKLIDIAKEATDILETTRKNWSFTQSSTGFVLTAGVQSYPVTPSLAGYESITSLYLGYDGENLDYADMKDFRYGMRDIPKTILTQDITDANTTIPVQDTTAFGTTGTLTISGDGFISYTGKTVVSFTGVTGISSVHTSNAEVFLTTDLDQPDEYTIWNSHFMFQPPPDKFYRAEYDFYRTIPRMENVTEETKVPFPTIITHYLMACIFEMKGKMTRARTYIERFNNEITLLKRKDRHKQCLKMTPSRAYIRGASDIQDAITYERIIGGN